MEAEPVRSGLGARLRSFWNKRRPGLSFAAARRSFEQFFEWTLIVVKLAGLLLAIALIRTVILELRKDGYSIQPFNVPASLEDAGYNGVVVAQKILDEMADIKTVAVSIKGDSTQFSADLKPEISVTVMGVGLSVESILYYVREILGREDQTVSGELTDLNGRMELTLRFSDAPAIRVVNEENTLNQAARVKDLFHRAAEEVLRWSDPYRLAVYYYRQERYGEALECVRLMLRTRPEELHWAYLAWGSILNRQKDVAGAEEKYRKAIELNSAFALPWVNLSWLLVRQARYQEAEKGFREWIRLEPQNSVPWNGLAICYRFSDRPERADAAYRKAIELDPGQIYWYGNYADYLIQTRKDTAGALKLYRQARAVAPETAEGYLFQSASLFYENKPDSALKMMDKALEIDPYNYPALQQVIRTEFFFRKNYAKATTLSHRAIRLLKADKNIEGRDQHLQSACNLLAMSQYRVMKYDSALYYAQAAIAVDTNMGYPYSTLAETYALMGERDKFYLSVEKAVRKGFQFDEQALKDEPYTRFMDDPRFLEIIRPGRPKR